MSKFLLVSFFQGDSSSLYIFGDDSNSWSDEVMNICESGLIHVFGEDVANTQLLQIEILNEKPKDLVNTQQFSFVSGQILDIDEDYANDFLNILEIEEGSSSSEWEDHDFWAKFTDLSEIDRIFTTLSFVESTRLVYNR